MTFPSQYFWDYSVAVYAEDGVQSACLFLQDHLGVDINLLLFCYWYGVRGGRLTAEVLGPVLAFARSWNRAVVQPQRQARRWMKLEGSKFADDGVRFQALRERIKLNELAAERYQQETMQGMVHFSETPTRQDDFLAAARYNVELLLASSGLEPDAACEERLELILQRVTG